MKGLFLNQDPENPYNRECYLETEHGFTLNIYERDFLVGVIIMENIRNAIVNSRRCILLITR